MTPYAVSSGYIPQTLVELFRTMRIAFENLPDFEGEVITCHAICTAFAKRYNLTCVDGWCGTGTEHSWLIDPKYPKVIMDMYPVGGASSFIVSKHILLPWSSLYIVKELEYDKVEYKRQVEKILEAM